MFNNLHFANPSASYFLLISLLICALLIASLNGRKKSLQGFASAGSLQTLLFLEKRTLLRYVLLLFTWFLATLALMQPEKFISNNLVASQNNEIEQEKWIDNEEGAKAITKRRHCDVIFLLDASASMNVKDTRQKCTRLESAIEIIDQMVSKMDGQNVALYTFTSTLTSVVPPKIDYFFTRLMLKDITINYGDVAGTDLFEAMEGISRRHFFSSPEKQKILLLLTDGGDTDLERLNKSDRSKQLDVMLGKMKKFEKQNVKIFTIGLGSKEGMVIPGIEFEGREVISSLDTELLTKLSETTQGQYYFANDYSALSLSDKIIQIIQAENSYIEKEEVMQKKLQREVEQNKSSNSHKRELFQIPLALAIILLGLEIILPLWPVRKKVEL